MEKDNDNKVIDEVENPDAKNAEMPEIKEEKKEPEGKQRKSRKAKQDKNTEYITKYNDLNDKYLRLSAEFDNYRKRTLKEKMDLTKTAGELLLVNLLPVIDDFDRALQNIDNAKDLDAVKQGIILIRHKFFEFLNQNGVKEIGTDSVDFNTDFHEAVTKFPAQSEKQKGKIIDVIEKGYLLHDKVIRFAKVVIGE